jgi:hypothetical protein
MNEAILYVLYSPIYRAVKIGISDISGNRWKTHKNKGWVLIKYWHFFERDKAKAVESLVIQTLNKKHKPFLSKEDMPQGGYTETFDASKISRRTLINLINKSIKQV